MKNSINIKSVKNSAKRNKFEPYVEILKTGNTIPINNDNKYMIKFHSLSKKNLINESIENVYLKCKWVCPAQLGSKNEK